MGTHKFDTNAEFDAGTKSVSDEAWEMETLTDNPSARSYISIANKKGSYFTCPSTDGLNWKWTTSAIHADAGTYETDIATTTSGYYMKTTGTSRVYRMLDDTAAGNFDYQVRMYPTGNLDAIIGYSGLYFMIDANEFAQIYFQKVGASYSVQSSVYTNGVSTFASVSLDSDEMDYGFYLRIKRVTNTCHCDIYRFKYPQLGYVKLAERVDFLTDAGNLEMYNGSAIANDWAVNIDFMYGTKTAINGTYRTSGNWQSKVQKMRGRRLVEPCTVLPLGPDANNYIDKIEWYCGADLKASYTDNLTTTAVHTINNADLATGSFEAVDEDWTVKIYWVGEGDGDFLFLYISVDDELYGQPLSGTPTAGTPTAGTPTAGTPTGI